MQKDLVGLMPDLKRLARALTRDATRADDLAQEALVRVLARSPGEIADLRPYLMTAARNLARRPGRSAEPLDDDRPETAAPGDDGGRLALRDVAQALTRLDPEETRLILAVACEGQSYAAVAASLGVPVGTVMSRLARARAHLRAEVGLEGGGGVGDLLDLPMN